MTLRFYKYQGTGNDFIILDNRDNHIALSEAQVKQLCDRRFGIGADGLMLLNAKAGYDFEMMYYNSDGRESTMCGNGGRCLVKFAYHKGIHREQYHFLAVDGPHEATITDRGWVHLKMKNVDHVIMHNDCAEIDTGSPHYIKPVTDVAAVDVKEQGSAIRYSTAFAEAGINVNFVEPTSGGIYVRTYERGVEDETLSCGTGVTASALFFAHNEIGFNRVEVKTPGGHLAVEFDKKGDERFEDIWLCGPAEFVFSGEITLP